MAKLVGQATHAPEYNDYINTNPVLHNVGTTPTGQVNILELPD